MGDKKRMNNRLLNPSCDENSVSKRTASRWKKFFAETKKMKIDEELSEKKNMFAQRYYSSESDEESTTFINKLITSDDTTPAIGDIDAVEESFCDDSSSNSSSDDIYSICSCCKSEIDSDDEHNFHTSDERRDKETVFDTNQVESDRIMFPASNLKVSDVLLITEMFSVSNNLTKSSQAELLKLIKILAGPDFEQWDCSYYLRSKIFGVPEDKITVSFFCDTCNIILTKKNLKNSSKKEEVQCDKCKDKFTVSSQQDNHFMSVDLRYQIQLTLNQVEIQNSFFNFTKTKNQASDICDIQDSELCKKLKSEHPNLYTLNFNTDGAPIFKSSKRSFWPQQLYINELPLEQRFKHIILGGLFLTDSEPKPEFMNLYNGELCNQIVDLMNNGVDILNHFTGEIINLKFTLLCCCVDTPARATCQNRMKFSGYYGCSWCYEPGLYVGNAVHYPLNEIEPELRTHESHLENIQEVEKIKKSSDSQKRVPSVMGVKGSTPFVEKLPLFDCVWGFPLDYMHGCLSGVTRQLLELLKTPGTKFKLNKDQLKVVDKRVVSIKPPREVYRLPRPTSEMSKWKASEFESWLLYWSLLCLDGIADLKFLEMYALFVRSVFTLLKRKITTDEIARSEYDLLKFVGMFQLEFSKSVVTFNMHSMLHLSKSVQKSGSLTGTSAFSFENGIFYLKKEVNGPRSVSHQIVKKFLKKKMLLSQMESLTSSSQCLNFCRELFLPNQLRDYLKLSGEIVLSGKTSINRNIEEKIKIFCDDKNASIQVYKKCIYKKSVIHSTDYTRAKKTNDEYIRLLSDQIIHVHHLIVVGEECYVYGCSLFTSPYLVGTVEMDHIYCITNKCEDDMILTNVKNFKEKVIYIEIDQSQYICLFPYVLNIN